MVRRASAPNALPRPRLILLLRVQAAGPRGLIQFEWESRPDLACLGAEGLAACEHRETLGRVSGSSYKDRFWNLTPRGVELLQQVPEPVLLRAEGERLASDLRQIAQRLESALRDRADCPERANLEALLELGALTRDRAPLKERCSELRRAAWERPC